MVVIKDLKRTAQSNPWNGIATVMVALQLLLGCIFYSHQQHGVSNFAKSAIDTSSTMLRSHLDVAAQQQPGGSRELEGTMEVLITDLFEATSSERLADIANEYSEQYATNSPFPHIAIDNIFPIEYLYKVKEEHPESDAKRIYDSGDCKSLTTTTGANCKHDKTTTRKSAINSESDMGMYTKILLSTMKSSTFIHFLEELTGISNLIPDPHYFGSGIHHTDGQGGKLDIHADFNRLNDYDLDRRVNVFIYLNDNWNDEFGGALELWSKDMKSCMQRIQASLGEFYFYHLLFHLSMCFNNHADLFFFFFFCMYFSSFA